MTKPLVVFRADASTRIGTGHVMRCRTLAFALRERGATCHFVCRDLPGNLASLLHADGFDVSMLSAPTTRDRNRCPQVPHADWLAVAWQRDAEETRDALASANVSPDWFVLDHYALNRAWQEAVLEPGCRSMVIDDLADRVFRADILLNHNYGSSAADYDSYVEADTRCLCGTRYALIKSTFAELRPSAIAERVARAAKGDGGTLLISMGGIDAYNVTGKVLSRLKESPLPPQWRIKVVMGAGAPFLNTVRTQVKAFGAIAELHVATTRMPALMAEADLCLGAAGTTSWERCAIGLPTVLTVLADNQARIGAALAEAGAARLVAPDPARLVETVHALIADGNARVMMARQAAEICDGRGTARVVDAILENGDRP